ncbi:MAG TPA: SMC-Scp complex subunit ScpB [Thermodesulfobacteriota bacterium]
MRKEEVKRVIESLLFVHEHPLTVDNIVKIIGDQAGKKEIKETLMELLAEYQGMGRSFQLVEVDGGYQFRTKAAYARWIKNLRKVKPAKLSQSALETLAIVVYRQPIVRAEIEHIRGVDSGWVLNSLLEKGLIKILGRKEVAGRPLVYGSSRRFLEIFGLRDLSALPTLQELDALRDKEGAEHQEVELPKEEE